MVWSGRVFDLERVDAGVVDFRVGIFFFGGVFVMESFWGSSEGFWENVAYVSGCWGWVAV